MLLDLWDQRDSVKLAGRYHAVYGDPGGRGSICSPEEPDLVELIGEEAENLVQLWSVLERNSLTRAIDAFVRGKKQIILVSHTGEPLVVSRQQYQDLAHIQVANSIEVAQRSNTVNYNLQKLHPALSPKASAFLERYYPGKWRMLRLRPVARFRQLLKQISGH